MVPKLALFVCAATIPIPMIGTDSLHAQEVKIHKAPDLAMPAEVDSNSPAFWLNGELQLLNSTGDGPMRSAGPDQFHLGPAEKTTVIRINPWPFWIEAVWRDPETGIVFAWYHQEHFGVCAGTNFSVPQIGAALSYDNGATWRDLGAILTNGNPIDCSARNGYFAGGNGDPSVMLDRDKKFFYVFYGNYNGPLEEQGVAVARYPFADRFSPMPAIRKLYDGDWTEPGLGGKVSPIFPAKASWLEADTNAFWGPSIHWNTYLKEFVILLNRSCCTTGFPTDGVYVTFNKDLSDVAGWTKPKRILENVWWYPQVLGEGDEGTDSVAGKKARLYVYGKSSWTIEFERPPDPAAPAPAPPDGQQ